MNNNPNSTAKTNLVETAAAQGTFKTFGKALAAADMTEILSGPGPFTVFAPTDAAFEKLPAGKLDGWLKPENKGELISVLRYHVTPGRLSGDDVGKMSQAKTVEGHSASIKKVGDKVTIDDANISTIDIRSTNGVIHAIDDVLVPTKH